MDGCLIIGAGFLGRELISWLKKYDIVAVNKKITSAKDHVLRFPEITTIARDIIKKGHSQATKSVISNFKGTVICLLPPSSFGQDSIDSRISNLLTFLEVASITRAILVSSTGVYSESRGGRVVCDSDASARTFRSARLLQIEKRWQEAKWDSVIVRFAGIYGKERIVGRSSLSDKTPLDGTGKEWLNLIHVVDAARALVNIANMSRPRSMYLLTDGNPLVREHYYEAVAQKYDLDTPLFKGRKSDSQSKSCDSSPDWHSLGITPVFTNAIDLLKSDSVSKRLLKP